MKHAMTFLTAGLLLAAAVDAAETKGVKPGEFTMDLDAAKAYAAEHQQPILLDFSGSDWCGWCQLMESNVFEKAEWQTYAKDNLVQVLIDFPQDKSRVPEEYVERNEALSIQYGIEGYPTFILLDQDGKTELGRLSAGQDKTPASFQAEIKRLLRDTPSALAAFAESLKPEDRAEFDRLSKAVEEKRAALKQARTELDALTKKSEQLEKELGKSETQLKEFRIAQNGEEKLKAYQELKDQFETKQKELMAWLQTQPERNDENTAKFEAMRSELMDLAAKIDAF